MKPFSPISEKNAPPKEIKEIGVRILFQSLRYVKWGKGREVTEEDRNRVEQKSAESR